MEIFEVKGGTSTESFCPGELSLRLLVSGRAVRRKLRGCGEVLAKLESGATLKSI